MTSKKLKLPPRDYIYSVMMARSRELTRMASQVSFTCDHCGVVRVVTKEEIRQGEDLVPAGWKTVYDPREADPHKEANYTALEGNYSVPWRRLAMRTRIDLCDQCLVLFRDALRKAYDAWVSTLHNALRRETDTKAREKEREGWVNGV